MIDVVATSVRFFVLIGALKNLFVGGLGCVEFCGEVIEFFSCVGFLEVY